MISPLVLVTVMAAPNERHGAASEQLAEVLVSKPFGETNVRCAIALAADAVSAAASARTSCARSAAETMR